MKSHLEICAKYFIWDPFGPFMFLVSGNQNTEKMIKIHDITLLKVIFNLLLKIHCETQWKSLLYE